MLAMVLTKYYAITVLRIVLRMMLVGNRKGEQYKSSMAIFPMEEDIT